VAEVARRAERAGARFAFLNADGFADATKADAMDRLGGPVDHLVYSVAAPRRTDPDTGEVYTSVIKPIGAPHRTRTLVFDSDGAAELKEVDVAAATPEEVASTVGVMGGADWARWVEALGARDLLAPGFTTVALSYIGYSRLVFDR